MTAERFFFLPFLACHTDPSPTSSLCQLSHNRQRDGINRQFGFGMRLEWKIHFNLLLPVWGSMMNTHDWYSKEANPSSLVRARPTLAGQTPLQACMAAIYVFSLHNSWWIYLLTFILHWEKLSRLPSKTCMSFQYDTKSRKKKCIQFLEVYGNFAKLRMDFYFRLGAKFGLAQVKLSSKYSKCREGGRRREGAESVTQTWRVFLSATDSLRVITPWQIHTVSSVPHWDA